MSRRALLAGVAAAAGLAAVLTAGYAAGGPAGLVAAATVAAIGVLIVARGAVPGQEPGSVRPRKRDGTPTASAAEFPAYRKLVSDLSWVLVSRRHYEYGVRPMLTRLAAALDRPDPGDLAGPADIDGPDLDLATLNRIITALEEDR